MCLSVYLGTMAPVKLTKKPNAENVGIEPASWTPPSLKRCQHVYYLGLAGGAKKLECSCLFLEHIDWSEDGPVVSSDDLYPETGPCPFETLRNLTGQALLSGHASIVCDDSGGLAQLCGAGDYCDSVIRLSMIRKGQLLFADVSGGIPWKHFYVIPDSA